jgi:HK97 family phage portal protein
MPSVLLWGNGFVEIERDGNFEITALQVLEPSKVSILYGPIEGKVVLAYKYYGADGTKVIPYYNMLHFKGLNFDGVQGQGVIRAYAKESIGLSIAAEQFGAKFFGNDTLMTKYISHPTHLSEEAIKNLRDSWQLNRAGLDNAFKMNVLEEGAKLENVGIPPEQAQFLATRQFQVEEICRWFKVQPHLIQHLLRSTNNNIEHQGIEFVTQTLTPWVVSLEQELVRKLFTEKEKKKYYVKFNMNSLLRGDIGARGQYYQTLLKNRVLSPNEVRVLEDMNPYDGGDDMLPLPNESLKGVNPKEDESKESNRFTPVNTGGCQGNQDS